MDNRTIEEVRNNETKLIKEIEILEEENQELKKQLDELQAVYNNMFKCHCNRVQVETLLSQQKEFIEWLVKMSKDLFQNEEYGSSAIYGYILSKYKEIIGVKDE